MNDRIKYNSSSLTAASSELTRLADVLEDVSRDLSRVDTSDSWWTKFNVSTSVGMQNGRTAVRTMIRDTDDTRDYTNDVIEGIRKVQSLFDAAERKNLDAANTSNTGSGYDVSDPGTVSPGEGGNSGGTGGSGGNSGSSFAQKHPFLHGAASLLYKVLGAAGTAGKTASAILEIIGGATGNRTWDKAAKAVLKAGTAWGKFIFDGKQKGYLSNPKEFFKNLVGLTPKNSSTAGSWIKRFGENFGTEMSGKVLKTGAEGVSSSSINVPGILDIAIDLGFSAYGNYKQVKNGEISADRAVVETVAETAGSGALGAVTTAAAAALLPATAPAVAVAAAGAGILWCVDTVTKKVTGGEKGLAQVASEGVGWVWDKTFGRLFD